MNNNLKWEGGTFTLSTIKEMPQDEWVSLILKTQTERAEIFGFTEAKFEAKLIKIWKDVNGTKEAVKDAIEAPKTDTKNNRKGGKK